MRVWSQFRTTPRPCQYRSASSTSALGCPFSTEIQRSRTASGVSAAAFLPRRSCMAWAYSRWPVSWFASEEGNLEIPESGVTGGGVSWVRVGSDVCWLSCTPAEPLASLGFAVLAFAEVGGWDWGG